jgi:integrase
MEDIPERAGTDLTRPEPRCNGAWPIATIEQVYALADTIDPMYRGLVLTATFTGLRLGELRALTRKHLDLLRATVHVAGQLQELKDGTLELAPPKPQPAFARVSIPAASCSVPV